MTKKAATAGTLSQLDIYGRRIRDTPLTDIPTLLSSPNAIDFKTTAYHAYWKTIFMKN